MGRVAISVYYEDSKEFPRPVSVSFDAGENLPSKYLQNYPELIRDKYIDIEKLASTLDEDVESINIFNKVIHVQQVKNDFGLLRYFFEVQAPEDDYYGCIDVAISKDFDDCWYIVKELQYTNSMDPKVYLKKMIETYTTKITSEVKENTSCTNQSNDRCNKITVPPKRGIADLLDDEPGTEEPNKINGNADVPPYSFVLALAVVCDKYSKLENLEDTLKALKYNGESVYDLLRR